MSTLTTHSLTDYGKAEVPTRKIANILRSFPHVCKEIRENLDAYFATRQKLVRNVDVIDGEIIRGDKRYAVTWIDSPEKCYAADSCILSFRAMGKLKYVLIAIAR